MKRVIVAPAALSGAALAELKSWLAVRTDQDDALLEARLRAALDMCESFTGTMPLTQVCEEVLPAVQRWTALSASPVAQLLEARRMDLSGARPLLEDNGYAFTLAADGRGRLLLTRPVAEQRLVVRYTAGLADDWEMLDAGLRQGIIRLAAHFYGERGADQQAASPPASVAALWQPWRRLRLR